MKLPDSIKALVQAQNNFDGTAYANCFTETAAVADEGHTHTGKTEIKAWIERVNAQYNAQMQPVSYTEAGSSCILTAQSTGTFPGSPITLKYHFEMKGKLIKSLRITS